MFSERKDYMTEVVDKCQELQKMMKKGDPVPESPAFVICKPRSKELQKESSGEIDAKALDAFIRVAMGQEMDLANKIELFEDVSMFDPFNRKSYSMVKEMLTVYDFFTQVYPEEVMHPII